VIRVILWVLAALLAAALALFCALAVGLFRIGLVRKKHETMTDREELRKGPRGQYADVISDGRAWFQAQEREQIFLQSYDGLRLEADFLPAASPSTRTILLFHGYRSEEYFDFSCIYRFYHELGLNILSVCQRSHGKSEGKYICFGVKERFDCKQWAEYIARRFGPETDIFLSGLSMGASTVLMAAGLELPENVRGVLADCGFTSPQEEFQYILKRMHLPEHPLLEVLSAASGCIAGFRFDEASTTEALQHCRVPVLLVHGGEDDFVPTEMSRRSYAACAAPKELIIVPGAGHGVSYLVDKPRCQAAIRAFLERYSTGTGEADRTE